MTVGPLTRRTPSPATPGRALANPLGAPRQVAYMTADKSKYTPTIPMVPDKRRRNMHRPVTATGEYLHQWGPAVIQPTNRVVFPPHGLTALATYGLAQWTPRQVAVHSTM